MQEETKSEQSTPLKLYDTIATDKLPLLSCKAFYVVDLQSNKMVLSKKPYEVREMASLTKMMTTFVALQLSTNFDLKMKETLFPVSKHATTIMGTSANLTEGQCLSIYDLLRGVMLPSGNDAALCLAENFGHLILCAKKYKDINF